MQSYLFDELRSSTLDAIRTSLGLSKETELILEIPPELKLGDFAFPCFRLAKELRKAPPMIAKELAEKLNGNPDLTSKFSIANVGPYVNLSLKRESVTGSLLSALLLSGDALADKKTTSRPNVIIEYSSPNVAKPFNIYHLRSTMIGNSIRRILNSRGFNPIAINHLGDWGTQFGTLSLAYQMWGDDKELEARGIEYLVELYVKINKAIETDETLADKSRENFSKLEKGDKEVTRLWQMFIDLSIKEFKKTYDRLGVHFDHYWGESFYSPFLPALEKELTDKKLLVESEGAHVVMLDAHNMPPCIVRKKDGSSIYATRDLAAAIYRHEKFNFAKMIYVVGGEQRLHFNQVFKVLELAGYDWAKNCVHVDFGLYRFGSEDGSFAKMSTRKGKFVTLVAVLDEAVERVREIMAGKGQPPAEADAEVIGTGAIVYNDLSTDRHHDVNFDMDRVCSFEGETGPYIQYAHTRCLSIIRNAPAACVAGIDVAALLDLNANKNGLAELLKVAGEHLKETEELDLIRTLAKLPLVLDNVLESYKPSQLAGFLIDITKQFNVFYRAHKVLVEDVPLARARLALVLATQRTLLKGLTLLGMRVPERM